MEEEGEFLKGVEEHQLPERRDRKQNAGKNQGIF
jgi:hypothetical protein